MTNAETDTAATVVAQGAHVAPKRTPSKKGAATRKGAPKDQKNAKSGKTQPQKKASKPAPKKRPTPLRADSKSASILALLRRPKGATLPELATLTGWQNHSIRGFLSGAIGKKMGLKLQSTKREDGERVYSIKH